MTTLGFKLETSDRAARKMPPLGMQCRMVVGVYALACADAVI